MELIEHNPCNDHMRGCQHDVAAMIVVLLYTRMLNTLLFQGEQERVYAQMDRASSKLPPADLAIYLASKGSHKKRQKLRDLYGSNSYDTPNHITLLSISRQPTKQVSTCA